MISEGELVFRLFLALILGGLIGLERESHNRPAGFRTHILVCLGSALVMLISIYGFNTLGVSSYDPARLAAQVVSGIGFLGAGTIVRAGATIRGLTTAASLWVVSAIGLAVGAGFYLGSLFTTGLAVMTLIFLDTVEKRFLSGKNVRFVLRLEDRPGQIGKIGTAFGNQGISIHNIELENIPERQEVNITFSLELPPRLSRTAVIKTLADVPGVRQAFFE